MNPEQELNWLIRENERLGAENDALKLEMVRLLKERFEKEAEGE